VIDGGLRAVVFSQRLEGPGRGEEEARIIRMGRPALCEHLVRGLELSRGEKREPE
jgi:hypothetical protein